MKKTLLQLFAVCMPFLASAQYTIRGTVKDSITQKGLKSAGLRITRLGSDPISFPQEAVQSNAYGAYEFRPLPAGHYRLSVSFLGYRKKTVELNLHENSFLDLLLGLSPIESGEIAVRATRARDRSGTAFTTLNAAQLSRLNLGKDLPYLLEAVPSAVASSDGGTGIGYTALRIRGSDPGSINVSINGIPFNDSESLQTYFVDVPDLASSTSSIQVQRGVGTSANGAGAFGGSVNIQTASPSRTAFAAVDASAGSFTSLKNTIRIGTGDLGSGWVAEGRLSRISTNGYIERASVLLRSFYATLAHYGSHDLLRFNVFSGTEKTYQAWNGVPEDSLAHHRRYNQFTYPNQTDNYTQDHYQAIYSSTLNQAWNLNAALHLTHGKGYFEEYESGAALCDYGIKPPAVSASPDTSDLVRRQWLDNYFGGGSWALSRKSERTEFTFGGAANDYRGLHFGEIIWTKKAESLSPRYRYYDNTGLKTDVTAYVKGSLKTGRLQLNADFQVRQVHSRYFGLDEFRQDIGSRHTSIFFNPKAGLDYAFSTAEHAWFSFAKAAKEPSRDDYVQATASATPVPEKLFDFEGGYGIKDSLFSFSANAFYMLYRDQLVLTGKLNDVGNPIRTNVPESFRRGLELQASWKIFAFLSWNANLSLSQNRLKTFTEVLYDESLKPIALAHQHTDIAFSPAITGFSDLSLLVFNSLHADLVNHYVGSEFLDNTSNPGRKLRPYFLTDLRLSKDFAKTHFKLIRISLALNNLAAVKYESSGSSYPYISQGHVMNSNYYFPQARFNFMLGLSVQF